MGMRVLILVVVRLRIMLVLLRLRGLIFGLIFMVLWLFCVGVGLFSIY